MGRRLSEDQQLRREAIIAAVALRYLVRLHRVPAYRRRAQARRVSRLGWGR